MLLARSKRNIFGPSDKTPDFGSVIQIKRHAMSESGSEWTWQCHKCQVGFICSAGGTETACPQCGSSDVVREVTGSDNLRISISEFVDLKAKDDSYPSKEKLRRHVQSGQKSDAGGRLVEKRRLIDRDADHYEEEVIDRETGEVLRRCSEPLSEHRGRGPAKRDGV